MTLNLFFRNFFKKNKLNTCINIIGFAVSLMFAILIGLYIQDESRIDSFHSNPERIYRLEHQKGVTFSAPIAPAIENKFPEIETTARILFSSGGQLFSPKTNQIYQSNTWYADSSVLNIFHFTFVEGDPHTALQSKDQVILSESLARRMFGTTSALGQRVKLYQNASHELVVSAVIRHNKRTHFKPVDIIHPLSYLQAEDQSFGINFNAFTNRSYAVYIKTKAGTNLQAKTNELLAQCKELGDPLFVHDASQSVRLVPLKTIYLHAGPDETGWFQANSATFITILGIIALLILIFAIINYINLSITQIEATAKSLAIRRLLGENLAN